MAAAQLRDPAMRTDNLDELPSFTLASPSEGLQAPQAVSLSPEIDAKRPFHPKLDSHARPGFGLPGQPGGDCRRLCAKHQRMVDGAAAARLQKSIENLSPADQSAVNSIWSLFSSCKSAERMLVLRGILFICCPSQLSFLSEQIKTECRSDPFLLLPREASIRCLAYLDAISLGRAAQVSKTWRDLADDDSLWRTMCQQHIERKCEKCGWGLPLLEKKRRVRAAVVARQGRAQAGTELHTTIEMEGPSADPETSSIGRPFKRTRSGQSEAWMDCDGTPAPRSRPSSRAASRASSPPLTKPWKAVYTERLVVERNWRKGSCAIRIFEGHTDAVTCLQFDETLSSPSFPVLMTGSWDRTVRIWNMESGACVNVLRGHHRGVRALQFDNSKLITGSMDATLKIWSWRTGECVRTSTLSGHRDSVICLAYDRHLLASGSADSTIKLWDFSTGECVTFRGHREWVNALQIWSPDDCEESLANDHAPPLADTEDRAPKPARLKLLFSGSDDGTIRVWDLFTRQCIRVLQGHVAQVQSLRIMNVPGFVPVMPTAVLGLVPGLPTPEAADYFALAPGACAPANTFAASDSQDPTSEESDEDLAPIDFGTAQQPVLISASLDNTIKLWDIEQGKCDRTLFGHVEGVWTVDSDKLRLVSGSHDRTIKVWDRSTGKCMHTLVGHRGAVTAVSLTDDKIVSGGDDGSCRLWSFGAGIMDPVNA